MRDSILREFDPVGCVAYKIGLKKQTTGTSINFENVYYLTKTSIAGKFVNPIRR